jgi:Skp family chaperone for outer membrane proteins
MKNVFKFNLFLVLILSVPVFAVDGMAVIDMRTAVLSTQAAADAFKALEEDADYASNLEEAQSLQAERQSIAENLQKDLETLSQAEIAQMLSRQNSTSSRRNSSAGFLC